ncbi:MAG: hypothetical protein RIT27_2483 [Pseudomonadota bacterium]
MKLKKSLKIKSRVQLFRFVKNGLFGVSLKYEVFDFIEIYFRKLRCKSIIFLCQNVMQKITCNTLNPMRLFYSRGVATYLANAGD